MVDNITNRMQKAKAFSDGMPALISSHPYSPALLV